jgi:undecaprenyl-diphosphatase
VVEVVGEQRGVIGLTGNDAVVWGSLQDGWFRSVNDFSRSTPWLHAPARMYAEYGVAVFAVLLLVSWWVARREGDPRRVGAALWAPAGTLIAIGVNQFLVAAFAEPRPYTVLPNTLVLVSRSTDFSFPSDHSVMAGAVAAGVFLANRRLGILTAALAVLMAVTRVYVGAHFPLDVLAGLVVGAALCTVSYLLVAPLVTRLVVLLGRTPAKLLVSA